MGRGGLAWRAGLPRAGWLGVIFLCRQVGADAALGDPTPDGVETDAAAYYSLAELDACAAPFEPWCAWLARRVLAGKGNIIPCAPDNPYSPREAFL